MANRAACQRRVYRLASLLTGNPRAAVDVITEVVDEQPNLEGLDSAHLDRLTVLRSREIPTAVLSNQFVDQRIGEALAALPAQQREAWIFSHVYRMDLREMSRAMDCSTTATERHLEQAEKSMKRALGDDVDRAARQLLESSMQVDVPGFYYAARLRRKRTRWLLLALFTAALIAAVLIGWQVLGGLVEDALRELFDP